MLTLLSESSSITSVDLLASLLFDDDSRAQTVFQLRERFPMFHGCPYKFAKVPEPAGDGPPLAAYSKQVLAWTAHEATAMGDYWIDTEHLLLGLMRVKSCTAASYLARTGLTLKAAREAIKSNKLSRPTYGTAPRGWRLKSWLFKSFVLS
jgi:ATP-dependent Clp protease ATP-binding subunit ClpA